MQNFRPGQWKICIQKGYTFFCFSVYSINSVFVLYHINLVPVLYKINSCEFIPALITFTRPVFSEVLLETVAPVSELLYLFLYFYICFTDVHETERVFKKIVHPTHGHNSIRLVDKDGIPLRPPNSAALSRLQSSYILTPRGVPARKSSHSYSGQIAKDKMHNLVCALLHIYLTATENFNYYSAH